VVTAAFAKNMPNFGTDPPTGPAAGDVTVYHGMPHGLCDQLRQPITPDAYVDTSSVHGLKREALAMHASQKDWLDASQGFDSYLIALDDMSAELGRRSGSFQHAEGWRRHLHLGFAAADADPLAEVLGDYHQSVQA
jgi:LmbE family N-acetylglucosaminyl deacetylase